MRYYLVLTLLLISCNSHKEDVLLTKEDYAPEPEVIEPLTTYTTRLMKECNTKESEAMQRSLVRLIDLVIPHYLTDREHQETYVALLCIESRFNPKAKSPMGATGVAQIMPKYAKEFASLCNLGELGPNDVEDTFLNLTLGACLFSHLLKQTSNSMIALAAYNAGERSSAVKELIRLGTMNLETANYVAKNAYLREVMKDAGKRTVPNGKGQGISYERDPRKEYGSPTVPSEQTVRAFAGEDVERAN